MENPIFGSTPHVFPFFKSKCHDMCTHLVNPTPTNQGDWDRISTFDPLGMTAHPPTIAACKAKLDIPELKVTQINGCFWFP